MTQVLIGVWLGCLFGLLVTPRGRDVLALCLADTRRVLGFDRGDKGRRWHEFAAAEEAADPGLRRAALVKDAYLAGEFDYDELEWRILLALMPPPPDRSPRALERQGYSMMPSRRTRPRGRRHPNLSSGRLPPYSAVGEHCRFHELHSGSGYVGTVCDCGHEMSQHYPGGCSGCNQRAARSQLAKIAPPKPSDAARSVLPTRPDPRLVDELLEW